MCVDIMAGRFAVVVAMVTQALTAPRVDTALVKMLDRFSSVGSRPGLLVYSLPWSDDVAWRLIYIHTNSACDLALGETECL